MPFQSRLQIMECFWVKREKALVLCCLVSKDIRIWKAFLNKSFKVWDFSLPFNLTMSKILKFPNIFLVPLCLLLKVTVCSYIVTFVLKLHAILTAIVKITFPCWLCLRSR